MRETLRQMRRFGVRAAGGVLLVLFAAVLTAGAVTGRQEVLANKTNTGAPGSTTVSSIKVFGNSQVVSDYQGAYFYILPCVELTDVSDKIYKGTRFHTTKKGDDGQYMEYRSLLREYGDDDYSAELMSWDAQYTYIRMQGYTSVPPQTSRALMFVPYETHNGTSLQEGWKADMSAVCYYDEDGGTPDQSYKITADSASMKSRIFAPAYDGAAFQSYCRNGVFYKELAKLTADKDRTLTETDLDIAGIREALGSKKALKSFVEKHKALQTQGYSLWCSILSLDKNGDTLNFSASDRIDTFIRTGYNSYRAERNKKYSEDNPLGIGTGSGLEGKFELKSWGSADVMAEEILGNRFARREYNLHVLDLMLCAYGAAVKQGAKDSVTDAWLEAICDYIRSSDPANTASDRFCAFPIAICGGTIARGDDQIISGSGIQTKNRIVYVGTQDLINFAELLENAGASQDSSEKTNSRSVTKSVPGTREGGETRGNKSSAYYLMKLTREGKTKAENVVNEEVFAFGKKKKGTKTADGYEITYVEELPEYYGSYYKRLKAAMEGGETGKVKNLEATSAAESSSWHSNVVLRAVINTMYTRDKNGTVSELAAKSDFRETIRLVRQKEYTGSNVLFQYKDCWGAMYVPSYLWPQAEEVPPEAAFSVTLTARSSLYAQAKRGDTSSTYQDVLFPGAPVLDKKDREIWKDNAEVYRNGRKDFLLMGRELTGQGAGAEAFQNSKESVQLQAQVVYSSREDKEAFRKWFSTVDKKDLKVCMTVTPLYGDTKETITVSSRKSDSPITCVKRWNTSYAGEEAESVTVQVGEQGKSLKLLREGGVKVDEKTFQDIFLPEGTALEGAVLTLDSDRAFFENTGFDVPQSKDGKKAYAYIGYQISVKVIGKNTKTGKVQEPFPENYSNRVAVGYSRTAEQKEDANAEVSVSASYTSVPESYCELKEGSVLNEQFEAMAGVPSTRTLYFSTGGSEFIVNLRCQYEANQKAERTYRSHFNGTDCGYRKGDALKRQESSHILTETFVADADGKSVNKSVQAQVNRAVSPKGAADFDTAVKAHGSSTVFTAKWTGTIENNTGEPADVGSFDAGRPGEPCAGNGFDAGAQRTKSTAVTNWDTGAYNTAVRQAIAWAKAMEATNSTCTVERIADSDGQIRQYRVGEAVISVRIAGGNKSNAVECGSGKSYTGGTYTSDSAADAVTSSSDSGRLGSGWSYTPGKKGTGGGYTEGSNGHDGECPGHGADADGNENPCDCTAHVCGSFTAGTDITQGASASYSYTIIVTFKNGKVLSGGNYDGKSALSGTEKNVGASLPAHALCGPCCEHVLPAVEDRWTQIVWFDTMSVSDMQVWKLEGGYVQGMSEILEGNGYQENHAPELAEVNDLYDAGGGDASMAVADRIYAAITQADPNIFYNIAAKNTEEGKGTYNTSRAGRLRYSLQTGQDDTVYYEEKNEKGELHRSGKCDGLAETKSNNPVPSGGKGHKDQPWALGCLYDNPVFVNGKDYHKTMTDALKTGYSDQTLKSEKTDRVDIKSEEWKRFDARRNQKVAVSVISDFLILQTSSGDQSVLYHEGVSKTVAAQENFGEVNVDTDRGNGAGFAKLYTANALAMKQGTPVNVGSYNGHYDAPETKYRGSGQGARVSTAFDNDSAKYNNISDELGKAEVKAGHEVTQSDNPNLSCAAVQERLPRVNGLVITVSGVIQCPTNINKEYTTGESYGFYKPLIRYTDNGARYVSATLAEDNRQQEDMRNNPNDQKYKKYVKPVYVKGSYTEAGYAQEKNNLLTDEIARAGAVFLEDERESRYLSDIGKESRGILIRSVYGRGKSKCNDIVVHDPVSAELARIVRKEQHTADLDQRTKEGVLDKGAAERNEEAAEDGVCPGVPGACSFRVLNCKYGQDMVRGAFSVDAYTKTLPVDEENQKNIPSEQDYQYMIYSSVLNENGGTPGISLKNSGFVIRSDSGKIPPEDEAEGKENYLLRAEGKASLSFSFCRLGIDSANTSERVQILADIGVKTAARMPVLATDHLRLFADADGHLSVETDDGGGDRSRVAVYKAGDTHRLGLALCFGTLSDFGVTVDGAETEFVCTKQPSAYEGEVCGPEFYMGNAKSGTGTDVSFTADNIQVIRLAGTTEHTDACYRNRRSHAAAVQNLYNGVLRDRIDWTGKEDKGDGIVTSENNVHVHSADCLTPDSEGFSIAFENGKTDASDLRKMTGGTLWTKIVQQFKLTADAEGKYTLFGERKHTHTDTCYRTENKTINEGNGGFTDSDWNQYVIGDGGPARLYAGANEVRYAAAYADTYADATLKLSAGCLTRDQTYTGLYLIFEVNGREKRVTANQAAAAGYIKNLRASSVTSYTPHPNVSTTFLDGGTSGAGVWAPATLSFQLCGYRWLGTSVTCSSTTRPGDGMWAAVKDKKLICEKRTERVMTDKNELFAFIRDNRSLISDTVTTGNKTIVNPVWNCRCAFDRHKCTKDCKEEKELKCNEPHHGGCDTSEMYRSIHYNYESLVCYDACCRDENHRKYQTQVTDEKGNVVRADDFILLDNYFDVYFPNRGNFRELDSYGIGDTQLERGMGYTADMDTTEWTREKWIKFPYSVLYNRNGIWEEHPQGEWFQLEIFDGDGSVLSRYHFYCQLKNNEMGSGEVEYAVEAVNHETTPGEVEKVATTEFYRERHKNALWPYRRDGVMTIYGPADGSESTNRRRFGYLGGERYCAYEDCWNHTWIDVVGRIGNLLAEDTDDLRFSNLFKETTDDGWLIDGILKTVDPNIQNRYLSWWKNDGTPAVDIRGETVCEENEWYNTYQTQGWTDRAGADALPLQADRNTVAALKNSDNELRTGYNVLWDISTIGNYANGTLQVIPYYYALNVRTGTLTPVDVYADTGDRVKAIQYFGLYDLMETDRPKFDELNRLLYAYNMTLNWTRESGRRNYTKEEQRQTEGVSADSRFGSFAYDADGSMVMRPVNLYDEENGTYRPGETPLVYNLTIPYGNVDFVTGTEQLVYVDCEPGANSSDGGRARTFIGSSTVTALGKEINGGCETNLSDADSGDYQVKGQRWHLTLGLPSTAEFVAYRGQRHVNPNELITVDGKEIYAGDEFKADENGDCDYVILMTADIRIIGDVYDLSYSQGGDNGVYRADNGSVFQFGDDIPTLLGVYGIGNTTTPDIDIMQTH